MIKLFTFLLLCFTANMLTFHLASVQSSQVDPAGETGGLQFSNSISTSELSLVESSDTAMKVRLLFVFKFRFA